LANPPAHGTVTVKRGTLKATNFKQYLATEVPAFVAPYHPAQNFAGRRRVRSGNRFCRRPQTNPTLSDQRLDRGGQSI
jgi:hypothetical protein